MGLEEARAAYGSRDWIAARNGFLDARASEELAAEDLGALADAAWWVGDVETSIAVGEEAYRRFLQGDRAPEAAMTALGIGYSLFLRGDDVGGSGWISRARRLLEGRPEGPEHGYLRYLQVEGALAGGDPEAMIRAADEVAEIGRRYGDANLIAAATTGRGRALVRMGDLAAGMALLDEAGLAVRSQDLTPEWAGNVYCHLIAACYEVADLGRAAAWTEALAAWCDTLAPATLFTGICRVHRAQILQTRGAWTRAESEVERVCEELASISAATVAEGHVAIGDLHRLRGDLDRAERAYEDALRLGRDPQPGHALLLLARGRSDDAVAAIDAALQAVPEPLARVRMLTGQVEILLATGAVDRATAAVEELAATADRWPTSGLVSIAGVARGRMLLAEGRAGEALASLRSARRGYLEAGASFDAAVAGALEADACRALGDDATARVELEAAAAVFEDLGARPAAGQVAIALGVGRRPDGLSEREVEVLTLVATGMTNRAIATRLSISQKTVARHLANIFVKIGATSRTEAAAYAFARGVATPLPSADGASDPSAR